MNLKTLYDTLDGPGRERLAAAVGVSSGYLWQMASRWRGKRPSIKTLNALVRADKRLKLAELMDEFADAEQLEPARITAKGGRRG